MPIPLSHPAGETLTQAAELSTDQEEIVVVPRPAGRDKVDDEVVISPSAKVTNMPEQVAEAEVEDDYIAAEGRKAGSAESVREKVSLRELAPCDMAVHIVLLGDSTLDNYRYLDLDAGDQTVEMLLAKRCKELGWELSVLAADGSTLDDVAIRQVPVVPDAATHAVFSASGNDLLRLLNEMSSAEFSARSMYRAVTEGLREVSRKYRRIVESLSSTGCHIACCTVYQPNFNHVFLKALAAASLRVHNGRLREISEDLDMSVLDLANICVDPEDFANPLELSTRGGCKVVENISQFVREHPAAAVPRLTEKPRSRRRQPNLLGIPMPGVCCVTCGPTRRIYAEQRVSEALMGKRSPAADRHRDAVAAEFAQAQEKWRQS